MKKVLTIIFVLLVCIAYAQVDRAKAPKPAAAREIKIGEYQAFTLRNGLQVFVVENHKLPRVQFTIQLKNDPILEKEKTGYVELAGELLGTGTTTRNKAQLDEEVDFIGASLNTSWNGIFASSLSKHRERLLELLTDVLYNPAFAQSELDKLKTQKLSELAADKDDPQAIAGNVRNVLLYGKDHTYGEISTEKSVEAITLADCKSYFNTYFRPNNAYLVIVGDIDLKSAKAATEKYFNKWTSGEVKNPTYNKPVAPAKTYVALVDRPQSVQSVISIAYPVDLKTGSQDAIKARVMNQILGVGFSARLMQNLREKHGYTYGASSQLNPDFLIGNFSAGASVRNEVTDSSVYEFMSELNRIVNEPVADQELLAAKAFISGQFGRSLENPQTIAGFAVNTAKYNLPKDYYNNYLKYIDAVTVADVQASAKNFIKPANAHIIIVGKGSDVADKLKKFGEVKYFDIYGQPYTPATSAALPAGLTAEKVLSKHVDAIGGLKKVQDVKTMKLTMNATVQGQTLKMTETKRAPYMNREEMSMNGMVMQTSVSDGKEVQVSAGGQKMPLEDKEKEAQIFAGSPFREVTYASIGAKPTLKGVEKVEGKDAYSVEFVLPKGSKATEYYDAESGLKVQTVTVQSGPQGDAVITVSYSDYKEVGGVKLPHTVTINGAFPVPLKFVVESYEINPKVDDATFKLN
jgi:predicted Zn-dependent peptidase